VFLLACTLLIPQFYSVMTFQTFDFTSGTGEVLNLTLIELNLENDIAQMEKILGNSGSEVTNEVTNNDELLKTSRQRDIFSLPNEEFVYHNKLPKCGSTTMHAILKVVSKWNNFRYVKLEPSLVKFYDGEGMSSFINNLLSDNGISKPFFIFKHHYYFNTTEYGLETPTWINVIRDPLSWFESSFYFKRFGWEQQPGARSRGDQNLTIDECVKQQHSDCARVKWKYN